MKTEKNHPSGRKSLAISENRVISGKPSVNISYMKNELKLGNI
jgi:hypothetical protein